MEAVCLCKKGILYSCHVLVEKALTSYLLPFFRPTLLGISPYPSLACNTQCSLYKFCSSLLVLLFSSLSGGPNDQREHSTFHTAQGADVRPLAVRKEDIPNAVGMDVSVNVTAGGRRRGIIFVGSWGCRGCRASGRRGRGGQRGRR
jgi:hypothetical protein